MSGINSIPPRRLLFSGGGIRVISCLGALQVLQEKNIVKCVREYCGVSAGALLALMLALDYSLHTIQRFCFEFDFSDISGVDIDAILDSLDQFGINSGDSLKNLIRKILYHKGFGPDTTFKQLADSGKVKKLRMWASDIQYMKLIEFSAEKTPDISVQIALYASMTLPMYFTPVLHPDTNTMLLDGGILDNYPISVLTEAEAEETLGFVFEYAKLPGTIDDFSSFFSRILGGYYMPSYQKQIEKYKHLTICIPCQEFSTTNFEATKEDRLQLVSIGRQAAECFFKNPKMRHIIRRNSVS
jgi:predicted acylesterase/phospholipase RssA